METHPLGRGLSARRADVVKVVEAGSILEAADTLRDFQPDITRGPGRKLGL